MLTHLNSDESSHWPSFWFRASQPGSAAWRREPCHQVLPRNQIFDRFSMVFISERRVEAWNLAVLGLITSTTYLRSCFLVLQIFSKLWKSVDVKVLAWMQGTNYVLVSVASPSGVSQQSWQNADTDALQIKGMPTMNYIHLTSDFGMSRFISHIQPAATSKEKGLLCLFASIVGSSPAQLEGARPTSRRWSSLLSRCGSRERMAKVRLLCIIWIKLVSSLCWVPPGLDERVMRVTKSRCKGETSVKKAAHWGSDNGWPSPWSLWSADTWCIGGEYILKLLKASSNQQCKIV